MPSWDINFGWVSSAQSLQAGTRELKANSDGFARMIVNDVAIAATERSYLEARRSLIGGVRKAVTAEVSRMAMVIGDRYTMPDKYTGPYGDLTITEGRSGIDGGMSETARRLGFRQTFQRQNTGIKWEKRSKRYLKWKNKHGHPKRWWELTGELQDFMGSLNDEFYMDVFGPISVLFTRPPAARRGKLAGNAIDPITQSRQTASGGVNVTHGGRAGRITAEYQVGKLEVISFGKITPQMLPALRQKNMNPNFAEPTGGEGLAGLFPNDGKGGIRNKLLTTKRGAKVRYGLEPFVSFFLTRAIPNAVWRRTERLIEPTGIRTAGMRN